MVFRFNRFGEIFSPCLLADIWIDHSRFNPAYSHYPPPPPPPPPYMKPLQTKTVTVVVFRFMRFGEMFSPSFWANIWIDYSRFDPAYSDSGSAGYNIDVGNGHSTLLPTLFLMASMVRPMLGPKVGEALRTLCTKPVKRTWYVCCVGSLHTLTLLRVQRGRRLTKFIT